MTDATAPDIVAFERWLHAVPGYERASVTGLDLAEGGASNITCRVALSDGPLSAVALRVQRDRGIFEPYDVIREAKLVAALAKHTSIPVPALVAVERSTRPLSSPFAVYEWIDAPHFGEAGPDASFGAFVDMVATIHRQPWQPWTPGILRWPASSAEANRAELASVAARMVTFGAALEPILVEATGVLEATVPATGDLALCQGDINVFNYLFRQGKVVGVVDWEQAHIGDPMSDVGQLVTLSHLKGAPWSPAPQTPFAIAYAAASGRDLANLTYFRALWAFQLAVIHKGWVAFNGSDPWYSWQEVTALLRLALDELSA